MTCHPLHLEEKYFRKVFAGVGIRNFYFDGGRCIVGGVILLGKSWNMYIWGSLIGFIRYITLRFLVFPFFIFQVLQMFCTFNTACQTS